MTGSEFVFLAIGLILGVAAGAALLETLRARSPSSHEVRVTVAPDAVPRRRATTLANDAFTDSPVVMDPARGGPADRSPGSGPMRTPVLPPRPGTVVDPVFRLVDPTAATNGTERSPAERPAAVRAMPVSSGVDPMLMALRASAAASAEAAMRSGGRDVAGATSAVLAAAGAGVATAEPSFSPIEPGGDPGPDRPIAMAAADSGASSGGMSAPAASPGPAPTESGPCGDARRLADERCELATRARAQAVDAEEAHRAVQRAYEEHEAGLAAATRAADPRAIRDAKDAAQARFRDARAVARTQEDIETAAREWLHEINRINGESAEANAALQKARATAPDMAVRLDRAALEADGARVAAEAAEAACVAARQALADCEERALSGAPAVAPVPVGGGPGGERAGGVGATEGGPGGDMLAIALRSGASPRIVRLLRGDRGAMQDAVAALAGDDPNERRRWQLAVSDLVDAILADAIAASALEYPTDHPFWGPFDRAQSRDITAALSSLGYRFDGLGGWVDDRRPSQRDLSLAMGYAGIDPMRIRQWPTEDEMAGLFSEVRVAGAEHLAGAAGDLTLGELVTMLGRRADTLTEIWNAWGRVRPVLLDEA